MRVFVAVGPTIFLGLTFFLIFKGDLTTVRLGRVFIIYSNCLVRYTDTYFSMFLKDLKMSYTRTNSLKIKIKPIDVKPGKLLYVGITSFQDCLLRSTNVTSLFSKSRTPLDIPNASISRRSTTTKSSTRPRVNDIACPYTDDMKCLALSQWCDACALCG